MTAPRIYRRAEWGARAATKQNYRAVSDIATCYAHYSDTHESIPSPSHFADVVVVQAIQRYHMSVRGYFDIAYAALIGGNGDIYLGRPNNVVQAAVLGHNHDEWSVCFLTDGPITNEQERSFEFLLWLADLNFPNMSHKPQPHSHAVATACPGDGIRHWLAARFP